MACLNSYFSCMFWRSKVKKKKKSLWLADSHCKPTPSSFTSMAGRGLINEPLWGHSLFTRAQQLCQVLHGQDVLRWGAAARGLVGVRGHRPAQVLHQRLQGGGQVLLAVPRDVQVVLVMKAAQLTTMPHQSDPQCSPFVPHWLGLCHNTPTPASKSIMAILKGCHEINVGTIVYHDKLFA